MRSSNNSLSITAIYKFAIFTIIGFLGSVFAYPLILEMSHDVPFYLIAISAALSILLLLMDVWVPDNLDCKKIRDYLWYPLVAISLPFISTFMLVRTGYDFPWIVNFVFANLLLWLTLRDSLTSSLILAIGIVGGAALGLTLNLYAPFLDHALFDDFALYSCVILLARLALVIRDRVYTASVLSN